MASPLSKFIHFAANDCGYSGTRMELIANWVHPLFLKAKSEANKEDNPNWRQAMCSVEESSGRGNICHGTQTTGGKG